MEGLNIISQRDWSALKMLYALHSLSRTEILIVALKETHEEQKTLHIPQLDRSRGKLP